MTSIGEVIKRRGAGCMRVCFLTHDCGEPQSEMVKRFGLENWPMLQIERHTAIEVLTTFLHRDLAYGVELMPRADAQGFASWLLEQFQTEESAFYSNGNWQSDLGRSWTPCTTSTFDGGVIATSGELAACIWFEDED